MLLFRFLQILLRDKEDAQQEISSNITQVSLAELDTVYVSLRQSVIDEESCEDITSNMRSFRGILSSLRRKLEQRRETKNTGDGLH